jgi:hypothetical protein
MFNNFSENRAVYEIMGKNNVEPDRLQMTKKNSACALHGGQRRLQTRTQNMYFVLLYSGNNSYANTCQCYVIITALVRLHCQTVLEVQIVWSRYMPCKLIFSPNLHITVNSYIANIHVCDNALIPDITQHVLRLRHERKWQTQKYWCGSRT